MSEYNLDGFDIGGSNVEIEDEDLLNFFLSGDNLDGLTPDVQMHGLTPESQMHSSNVLNVQLIHIKIKTHKNPSVVKSAQILVHTKINQDNLVAKTTFVDVQQEELLLLELIVLLTTHGHM